MAKKKEELDDETLAIISWCTELEEFLVQGGASREQAQDYIEDDIELLTDYFYDGLTPEEASAKVLHD